MAMPPTPWATHRSYCSRNGSAVEIVLIARFAGDRLAAIVSSSGNGASGDNQPRPVARWRQRRDLAPAHQPGAGDLPVGIALA